MSVGGAYAAALAARHPDRVAALALVAAPRETRTAMGPLDAEVERARPEFTQWAAGVNVADPDDTALAARWLGSQPPDDAALLAAALSTADVAASAREALACPDGYLRDAALLFSDWGFDLSDVRCPTHLWYGAHDDRNPPATGRWWADRVTGADATARTRHARAPTAPGDALLRETGAGRALHLGATRADPDPTSPP